MISPLWSDGMSAQVDLIMSRHGDGNGRIEEAEFHDFVQRSMLQSRKREGRSKARTLI